MARIRSIKPEFFTSDQLVECSTNARLLFVGLWVFADDCGRHALNAKKLKMEVFPGDNFTESDINDMICQLWSVDLITVYVCCEGELCIAVTGWHHQKIDRPQPPKFPDPLECETIDYSTNARRMLDEYSENARRPFVSDRRDRRDTSSANGNTLAPVKQEPKTAKRTRTVTDCSPEFEAFWKSYPDRNGAKVGKLAAWQEWQRIDSGFYRAIVDSLPRYRASLGNLSPRDASRFLRDRLWLDLAGFNPDSDIRTADEIISETEGLTT